MSDYFNSLETILMASGNMAELARRNLAQVIAEQENESAGSQSL